MQVRVRSRDGGPFDTGVALRTENAVLRATAFVILRRVVPDGDAARLLSRALGVGLLLTGLLLFFLLRRHHRFDPGDGFIDLADKLFAFGVAARLLQQAKRRFVLPVLEQLIGLGEQGLGPAFMPRPLVVQRLKGRARGVRSQLRDELFGVAEFALSDGHLGGLGDFFRPVLGHRPRQRDAFLRVHGHLLRGFREHFARIRHGLGLSDRIAERHLAATSRGFVERGDLRLQFLDFCVDGADLAFHRYQTFGGSLFTGRCTVDSGDDASVRRIQARAQVTGAALPSRGGFPLRQESLSSAFQCIELSPVLADCGQRLLDLVDAGLDLLERPGQLRCRPLHRAGFLTQPADGFGLSGHLRRNLTHLLIMLRRFLAQTLRLASRCLGAWDQHRRIALLLLQKLRLFAGKEGLAFGGLAEGHDVFRQARGLLRFLPEGLNFPVQFPDFVTSGGQAGAQTRQAGLRPVHIRFQCAQVRKALAGRGDLP